MISRKKKKDLTLKVINILLVTVLIVSIIRIFVFHTALLGTGLIYIIIVKEIVFSIFSILLVVLVLYIMMKEEIKRLYNSTTNYAFTDSLTGLYNRHYLNNFLDKFSSMRKEDTIFSILSIDIDNFKEVNNTLGDSAGDCILKSLAWNFKSLIRPKDILCRYGGEEFVIIFSDISKDNVLEKAELIRTTVQNMHFNCKKESITVSIGVSFGTKDDDINIIMKESDKALYMAKDAGKNCVKVFNW